MPIIAVILLIQLGLWFVILFDDGFTSKIKAVLWFFACLVPVLPFLIVAGMKIGEIK
jgi:hypothetical protein